MWRGTLRDTRHPCLRLSPGESSAGLQLQNLFEKVVWVNDQGGRNAKVEAQREFRQHSHSQPATPALPCMHCPALLLHKHSRHMYYPAKSTRSMQHQHYPARTAQDCLHELISTALPCMPCPATPGLPSMNYLALPCPAPAQKLQAQVLPLQSPAKPCMHQYCPAPAEHCPGLCMN